MTSDPHPGPAREFVAAALLWQLECGVDEVIAERPINRLAPPPEERPERRGRRPGRRSARPATTRQESAPSRAAASSSPVDAAAAVTAAERAATAATTREELRQAVEAFDLCELKRGARTTVFSDGNPVARILILGEAPGREEDIAGRPFVGRAGKLLDRMFACIGLARTGADAGDALYITNVMPWRPPGNRDPTPEEIAMMLPFARRHIALIAPDVVVTMGNTPLFALAGRRGILRARGHWFEAEGRPVLPMVHPAYLLRNGAAKREAWADLLALQARLRDMAPRDGAGQ